MKRVIPAIGVALSLLAVDASRTSAQTCSTVIGSGAVSAADSHARLTATVGQSAVGIVAAAPTEALQGFWHTRTSSSASVAVDESAHTSLLSLAGAPNPFSRSTVLSYIVPDRDHVSLTLFDATGKHVRTLADEVHDAGSVSSEIDLSDLPSGSYTAVLRIGDRRATTTLLLVD